MTTAALSEKRMAAVAPARTAPTHEPMTVTPAMAEAWLETMRINRPLKTSTVEAYANDMEAGRWRYTAEGVKFDWDGALIDGQHRLHACVISGRSFRTLVVRGLPPDAQEAMDQGVIRRPADILAMRGATKPTKQNAAARALIQLGMAAIGNVPYRGQRQTTAQILDIVARHPKLVESITAATKAPPVLTPALLAAIHYVGTHLVGAPEKADAFLRVFVTGVRAYEGDPAHAFREFLLKHRGGHSQRLRPEIVFYGAIRAWNAFVNDDTRTKWSSPREPTSIAGLRPEQIFQAPVASVATGSAAQQ